MMADKKVLIIDQAQIQKKITRLSYQILEDHFEEDTLVLVGIASHGYILAERLKDQLEKIAPEKTFVLVRLTIDKTGHSLKSVLDTPIESLENKALLLIDDVLSSGKTLTYGMGTFLNIPLKKMRTAVLIDRSHHQFPVSTDFFGLKLATTLKEHVSVHLRELDQVSEDAAWLS